MTTFSQFIKESETHSLFQTTKYDVKVVGFKHPYMSKHCLVHVFSKTRTLDGLIIEKDLIADAKSCTALLRVVKTVKAVKGNDFSHYMDELCYLYKNYLAEQSNPNEKPQSDEQDGTVVVVIAKDNKAPANVGFHPSLAGLPVCHPSTSPLLGRGGSFIFASALPFRQKSHTFGVGVGGVPALALLPP